MRNLDSIWADTPGDVVTKAHAILKDYFKPHKFQNSNPWLSAKENAIRLFVENRQGKDGTPLNTVEDLLNAAAKIAAGPQFMSCLDAIKAYMEQTKDNEVFTTTISNR